MQLINLPVPRFRSYFFSVQLPPGGSNLDLQQQVFLDHQSICRQAVCSP